MCCFGIARLLGLGRWAASLQIQVSLRWRGMSPSCLVRGATDNGPACFRDRPNDAASAPRGGTVWLRSRAGTISKRSHCKQGISDSILALRAADAVWSNCFPSSCRLLKKYRTCALRVSKLSEGVGA